MEYTVEYTNDREEKIDEQETLSRQMLHDDFTTTGGLLTFVDPIPKTEEQLAEEAETLVMLRAEDLIDAISNLAGAKVFLKILVNRLIKKGLLP